MKFRITDCKGFYFGFDNGWGVSVQFGPGNYADNYDMRIGNEDRDAGRRGWKLMLNFKETNNGCK